MEDHQDQMNFRFVSEDMKNIIGSDSKNIKSDLSSLLFSYRLDQKIYKRQKNMGILHSGKYEIVIMAKIKAGNN